MTDDLPPTWRDTISRAVTEQLREVPVVKQTVGQALAVVLEDARARRDARFAETVTMIAQQAGDIDRVGRRLVEDEELEALFIAGINAAVDTGLDAKRRHLARVISAAVLDDALVDESALIVRALRDLDAPHFRALERIRRVEDEIPEDRSGVPPAGGWPSPHQRVVDTVEQESEPVIAALLRAGMLRQVTGGLTLGVGGPLVIIGLSKFGRALLADVRACDSRHQL